MPLLRPRERLLRSAASAEARIKYCGRRMHKRFRSWAQQRVRQYWLPQRVSLHADPSEMSAAYLSAAVQKAATLRKHDAALWFGFSRRAQQIADEFTPQQMGYLFYGFGKARFLDMQLYSTLLPYAVAAFEDFHSHALMCIAWALARVLIKNGSAMTQLGEEAILKAAIMRPGDMIKIATSLAKLGVYPLSLRARMSDVMLPMLRSASALEFRNSIQTLAVINLYTQPLKLFVMERFSRIVMCARPCHLDMAFKTAVAVRVTEPETWSLLPRRIRQFYARLSLRRIPQAMRRPSAFHWDVSDALARLGVAHRNTFHWGCYWLDIGEAEESRRAWFVDGPSAFYTGTSEYTQDTKIKHRVLCDLGWEIRRVRWMDWALLKDDEAKLAFMRQLREAPALPSHLPDVVPSLPVEEIRRRLKLVQHQHNRVIGVADGSADLDV